ncbi:MAG: rhomboid family intramembrane serine protease [Chloroflexota bacterium]
MQPQKQSASAGGQVSLRIPSNTPIFTYLLWITLLVVALAHFMDVPPAPDPFLDTLSVLGVPLLEQAQFWRLISALLLIATPAEASTGAYILGAVYLGMSLYTLWIVGMEMEPLWGSQRTILVYLLGGGLGGAVSVLLMALGLRDLSLGTTTATAGLMALIGAQMVYLFKHRKLYRQMAPQRQAFLLGVALVNLILAAFAAHADFIGVVFAMIGGGVLAAYISPFMLPRPHPDEPNALLAEDVNPLRGRLIPVTVYTLAVMAVVAAAIQVYRLA